MASSTRDRLGVVLITLALQALQALLALLLLAYYRAHPPAPGAQLLIRAQVLPVSAGAYDADPGQASAEAPAAAWQATALPLLWARAALMQDTRPEASAEVHWVRVELPPSPDTRPRHLYITRWQTIGTLAVYADDRLVYRTQADRVWNGFNHPLLLALDAPGAAPAKTITLRVASRPGAGGAVSSLWVGPEAALDPPFRARQVLQVLLPEYGSVAALGLGVFAFAIGLGRRGERLSLLFGLFALSFWLRGLHFHMGLRPQPILSEWFGWITVNAVNVASITWFSFVAALAGSLPRWPGRLLWGMSALGAALTLPLGGLPSESLAPWWYLATLLAGCAGVAWAGLRSWRVGSLLGISAAVIGVVDFGLAGYDLGMVAYRLPPEGFYTTSMIAVLHLAFFAWVLLRRYLTAVNTAKQASTVLAQRLHEREAELRASHEQLRAVQEREAVNRERQRLMEDLHDGMGAQLISALRVAESGRLDEAQMRAVLRECIDDLKLTVDTLEPVDTDLPLLLATLRYRLQPRLLQAGLQIEWQIGDVPPLPWLDPRAGLHVLRILQEAFSNVLQHAAATRLRVATAVEGDGVVVVVEDDGLGIAIGQPSAAADRALPPGGRGRANMLRRAAALGGSVSWLNTTQGMQLRLWLPLQGSPG